MIHPGGSPDRGGWRLVAPVVLAAATLCAAFVLLLTLEGALGGDFLGSVPQLARSTLLQHLDLPDSSADASSSFYLDSRSGIPCWLLAGLWLAACSAAALLTFRDPIRASTGQRLLLLASAAAAFGLLLGVMAPLWVLVRERAAPSVLAVAIDESASLQTADGGKPGEPRRTRMESIQRYFAEEGFGRLASQMSERPCRVHLYALGDEARLVGEYAAGDEAAMQAAIADLRPNRSRSALGAGIRSILDRSHPFGIVVVTDGVVTGDLSLADAGRIARNQGVPLFLAAVGQPDQQPRLVLSDVLVSEEVHVSDTLVVEGRLAAEGEAERIRGGTVELKLVECGKPEALARQNLRLDSRRRSAAFRLEHRLTEPGNKEYEIQAEILDGRASPRGSSVRVRRQVVVLPAEPIKILYLEGFPRYEYRFLRDHLERARDPSNFAPTFHATISLPGEAADMGRSADAGMYRLPGDGNLASYDVVILGDIDLTTLAPPDQRRLVDYVSRDGGGLLFLPGPHHGLDQYRESALAPLLPVYTSGRSHQSTAPSGEEGYVLSISPGAHLHPAIAGLRPDGGAGSHSRFWWATKGAIARPEFEVLAVHPRLTELEGGTVRKPLPLLVAGRYGQGRCVYCGAAETWRWRAFDESDRYERWWLQMLRFLGQRREGRVSFRLEREQAFRPGAMVRVLVQFSETFTRLSSTERSVMVRREGARGEILEMQPHRLQPLAGARGLFALDIPHVAAGEYRVALQSPALEPRPGVRFTVHGPPGELEEVSVAQSEMQAAARISGGRFAQLAEMDTLWRNLPNDATRVLQRHQEAALWDHPLVWCLIVVLLCGNWFYRRCIGPV